jgi:hypothetical protein
MYYSKRKLYSLLFYVSIWTGIGILKYCESPRYKKQFEYRENKGTQKNKGVNMDKKTLNELIDFADSTKQLHYIADIISFYQTTYKQCNDEREAFRSTIKTYDLSWHPDYKLIFENYHEKHKVKDKDEPKDDKPIVF